MMRNSCIQMNSLLALSALVLALGAVAPARVAGQSNSGVVDIVKPAPQDTPNAAAPKADADPDAPRPGEPTDPKARKTFAGALDWEQHRAYNEALEDFRKANKQDGGHCAECLVRAYKLAIKLGAYKDAEQVARDMLPLATSDADRGNAHFALAMCLQQQGVKEKKDQILLESSDEFKAALQLNPKLTSTRFHWGVTLARLHQDDAARAQFTAFLDEDRKNPSLHERAQRFLDRIDLARATMAPPFMATTLDGRHISMDSLAGRVVLIDFWATWCGPCREALPHVQRLARKFEGQPFVVLSISVDKDEDKWKSFVEKNGMTWLQVRDGGLNGSVSKKFGVSAIPATFSIDADGVLEDQHVGDADIEGKLKKMIAHAVEVANRKPVAPPEDSAETVNQQ
jgi:thiol-disulfide isomerase/thioredoxin